MNKDNLWFTNARMQVRLSNRDNESGLSILENIMPHGFSPPLHVHHSENETFYVLEGNFRFEMDGKSTIAGPGDVVHVPAGAKHSFLVTSPDGARCLTITQGGFEDMVREASRPATNEGLPEQSIPNPEQQQMLAEACRRNGIDLLGAPLAA
jgi:quercetin dioxygenase-like cupin family protein